LLPHKCATQQKLNSSNVAGNQKQETKNKEQPMPVILPVEDKYPKFGNNNFIAPNATIVGDVIMGDDCSIWFNAVLRGDVNFIRMGNKVNVQDGACIHCTYQRCGTTIGSNVSIGHNAIVHGCTLEDNVLIGMGAIIMDNAIVQSNTIIAAGAVVLEGTICEAGSIYAGVPAKKVKTIDKDTIEGEINRIANNYVRYADWFREQPTES
jgi:carbonic anhydrase/acetyltransferase-like protein (isoleucine patch superfamily)